MTFYFTLDGDSLLLSDYKTDAKTGNVNSYTCKFQPDDAWGGLNVFSCFKSGEKVYRVALSEENTCTIPCELLAETGEISVGVYATNFDGEDFKRISSNWVSLTVTDGAYNENSTAPAIPTPDFWEELASKMTPKIGENGNWFLWDLESGKYHDTSVSAKVLAEPTDKTDSRYLLRNKVVSEYDPIENIDDYIPNTPILDCFIHGISYLDKDPTITNSQEIFSVGDLITDTESKYLGKYHIPYTFNDRKYNLYLDTPLKGLMHYGTTYSDLIGIYDYNSDYIDFKNKCLVRNVGELVFDDISVVGEHDGLANVLNDTLWARTVLPVPDMTTHHPSGRWIEGDILSNRLQTYRRSSAKVPVTDNYIMTIDGDNNLYFCWDLSLLGFSYEISTETDYLLKTASGICYKVKDENSNYITDFSKIRERIRELYKDEPVKIYYPLSSPKIELLELPSLFMPESGAVSFDFDTTDYPREISLTYYVDITKKFEELNQRVDNLEAAILSMGADI